MSLNSEFASSVLDANTGFVHNLWRSKDHSYTNTHFHKETNQWACCEQPVPFTAGFLLCYTETNALFPPYAPQLQYSDLFNDCQDIKSLFIRQNAE